VQPGPLSIENKQRSRVGCQAAKKEKGMRSKARLQKADRAKEVSATKDAGRLEPDTRGWPRKKERYAGRSSVGTKNHLKGRASIKKECSQAETQRGWEEEKHGR